jgi:hypothetical protein
MLTFFKDVYGLVHNIVTFCIYIYVLFISNCLHLSLYGLYLGNGSNLNCAKITIYSPKTLNFHRSSEMSWLVGRLPFIVLF